MDLTDKKQAQEWFIRKMRQAGFKTQMDLAEYLETSRPTIVAMKDDPQTGLAAKLSPMRKVPELVAVMNALRISKDEIAQLLPDVAALFPNTGLERPRIKQHTLKGYKNPKKNSDLVPLTEAIGTFDLVISSGDLHPNLEEGEVVRCNPTLSNNLEITKSYFYSDNEKDLKIGQCLNTVTANRVDFYNFQDSEKVEVHTGDIVGGIVKISRI